MDMDSHERVATGSDNEIERPVVESSQSTLNPGPSAAPSTNTMAGRSIITSSATNNTLPPTVPTMTPSGELSHGLHGDGYGNLIVRSAFSDEYVRRSMAQNEQERVQEREEGQRRIAEAMANARVRMAALYSHGSREETDGIVSGEVDREDGSSSSRNNGGGEATSNESPSLVVGPSQGFHPNPSQAPQAPAPAPRRRPARSRPQIHDENKDPNETHTEAEIEAQRIRHMEMVQRAARLRARARADAQAVIRARAAHLGPPQLFADDR